MEKVVAETQKEDLVYFENFELGIWDDKLKSPPESGVLSCHGLPCNVCGKVCTAKAQNACSCGETPPKFTMVLVEDAKQAFGLTRNQPEAVRMIMEQIDLIAERMRFVVSDFKRYAEALKPYVLQLKILNMCFHFQLFVLELNYGWTSGRTPSYYFRHNLADTLSPFIAFQCICTCTPLLDLLRSPIPPTIGT